MTPDRTRSLLDPMPLAARASIGRGAAAVMAMVAVAGGAVAFDTGTEDISLAPALVVAIVGTAAAAFLLVVFAPWQRVLSNRGQEALLAATMVVPAAGVAIAYAADDPADTDALVFLAAIFVASALTVPLRWHIAGALTALTTVAGVAAARGALADIAFVLVVSFATGCAGRPGRSRAGRHRGHHYRTRGGGRGSDPGAARGGGCSPHRNHC